MSNPARDGRPPSSSASGSSPSAVFLRDEFHSGVTACLRSWSVLRTAVEMEWGGRDSIQKADDLRSNIYDYMDGVHFPPKNMDLSDLEDAISIYMEEQFSVVFEDGSERQVAETLWRMYEDCFRGDPTLCRQVVASAHAVATATATTTTQGGGMAHPVQLVEPNEDEDDDDDDDDEMMEDCDENHDVPLTTTTMTTTTQDDVVHSSHNTRPTDSAACSKMEEEAEVEVEEESLFGKPRNGAAPSRPTRQLGQPEIPRTEPEVDEDGFAPVTSKRKAKKKSSPSALR